MKKLQRVFLWACAMCTAGIFLFPTSPAQAAPVFYTNSEEISIEDTTATMTVSCSSSLLVRSGPGKSYDRLGSVNNGDTVEVTGICANGWYRISFDQKEGYVYGDYLVASAGESDGAASQETAAAESGEAENTESGVSQWFSTLDFPALLPLLIPVVIILILAVSALFMFRSIRRDTEEDEEYEDEEEDEDEEEEPEEEEVTTRVMRKSTPLPRVSHAVTSKVDSNMLDSQIRNFVVDDIGDYLDEEKEEEETPELAELEDELEATQQHLLELQRQMEQLKKKR